MGQYNDNVTAVTDAQFPDESIATKIRAFIVVKEGKDCCSCLPILTYGTQGVAKNGVIKWQHSIAYSGRDPPLPTEYEEPKEGEHPMMTEIRVVPKDRRDKLDAMSRINYQKIYTVEHNAKVYDFGDVHKNDLHKFYTQWMFVLKRDNKRKLDKPGGANEESENDDGDYGDSDGTGQPEDGTEQLEEAGHESRYYPAPYTLQPG